MEKKIIYIIRHCSALGQGDDAHLTAEGTAQSEILSDFLRGRGIQCIISSPSTRAMESIAPFADRSGIDVRTDDRLRERMLSSNQLENWMECLKSTFDDRNLRYDKGETSNEADARSKEVIREVISGHLNSVAIVTHGNLMALMLGNFDQSFGFQEWGNL